MNSGLQGNNIKDVAAAQNLVQQVRFSGMTPMGTQLDQKASALPAAALADRCLFAARALPEGATGNLLQVMRPLLVGPVQSRALRKPLLVIVITDGARGWGCQSCCWWSPFHSCPLLPALALSCP